MPNRKPQDESPDSHSLRERAEEILGNSRTDLTGMSSDDIQQMLYELQVHQIELKLQNEELRDAQLELSNSRDLYSDLYEFAPVGYLTLDPKGTIRQANLTMAEMLGIERGALMGRKLSELVVRGSSDDCHRHLQAVFSGDANSKAELTMLGKDNDERVMQLESFAVERELADSPQC